jgi:hypothetical protein
VGFILGTFAGWITGLVLAASGNVLLGYMIAGAVIGGIGGALVGILICNRDRGKAATEDA